MSSPSPPGILAELTEHGLNVVSTVITQIRDDVVRDPGTMLSRVTLDNGKPALRIDLDAEDTFERELRSHRRQTFKKISFYGEERLDNPNLDLRKEPGTCALVDAIDGTDLLERGLGNWCSAAVFFNPTAPPKRRILASYVAVPSSSVPTNYRYSDIYYSTADDIRVVHVTSTKDIKTRRSVFGPSKIGSLKKASICFYGQKARNFCSVFQQVQNPKGTATLFGLPISSSAKLDGAKKQKSKKSRSSMRIYTLAGIPMMVRLIDHMAKKANNIDVVFDLCGQNPHDVIPGAYLAMKAGAHVRKFIIEQNKRTGRRRVSARRMEIEDLEESLMRPAAEASKLRYVISSTRSLAAEIEPFLLEFIERQLISADK